MTVSGFSKGFRRAVASLLLLTLLAGCSGRHVRFISTPDGAKVDIPGKSCTTPCSMRVPDEVHEVIVTTADGKESMIDLDKAIVENSADEASAVGEAFTFIGAAFIGAGLLGMSAEANDETDTVRGKNTEPGKDLLEVSLISIGIGALLASAGGLIDQMGEHSVQQLDVTFNVHRKELTPPAPLQSPAVESTKQGMRYDDVGTPERSWWLPKREASVPVKPAPAQ